MMDFDSLEEAEQAAPDVMARHMHEQARDPIPWNSHGDTHKARRAHHQPQHQRNGFDVDTFSNGIFFGLKFPSSEKQLLDMGPAWLTEALHTARTLPEYVKVTAIQVCRRVAVRGSAAVLHLRAKLAPMRDMLCTDFLVKLPVAQNVLKECALWRAKEYYLLRAQDSRSLVDRFAEINFYRLFQGHRKLNLPQFYFGDVDLTRKSFILIVEWVPLREPIYKTQECILEGCMGYLSIRSDGVPFPSACCLSPLSSAPGYSETWSLIPANAAGSLHVLKASNGAYLKRRDATLMEMSVNQEEAQMLQLRPVRDSPGSYVLCFPDPDGTHVASNLQGIVLDRDLCLESCEVWKLIPSDGVGCMRETCDLRDASFELCEKLVHMCAQLAGLHKSEELGPHSLIDASFPKIDVSDLYGDSTSGEWNAFADSEWLSKAAVVQDFMFKTAGHLFPTVSTNPAVLKDYTAVLFSARANIPHIHHFCHNSPDYVALCPSVSSVDSLFYMHGEVDCQFGLLDWDGVSVGSLGFKLWKLLSCAELDVFESLRWKTLLSDFITQYSAHGGPRLDLDILTLHFQYAAMLQTVSFIDLVPALYDVCPKDKWATIPNINDACSACHSEDDGVLWLSLRSFVNVLTVVKHCDLVRVLKLALPHAIMGYHVSCTEPCITLAGSVAVRAEATRRSQLVCCLPLGSIVFADRTIPFEEHQGDFVYIWIPVRGWVLKSSLRPESSWDQPDQELYGMLGCMDNTRRQYMGGGKSEGMCVHMARKLYDELLIREELAQFITQLGRGSCTPVAGGFLVSSEPQPWWPRGYNDWYHHCFVAFDDGTIADITADQFGDFPQLWFPADANRYTYDVEKPNAAQEIRIALGKETCPSDKKDASVYIERLVNDSESIIKGQSCKAQSW